MPPSPPPPPYSGFYALVMQGSSLPIRLSSFGGCNEKTLGVEYEDCYFQVRDVSNLLLNWLNDTVTGTAPYRDLTVIHYTTPNTEAGRLLIVHGFLREFQVSDFDEASKNPGAFTFVVVPSTLSRAQPVGATFPILGTTFLQTNFRLDIAGVDASQVVAVRNIRMSVDKIVSPQQTGLRRRFVPSAPQFDPFRVENATGAMASWDDWTDRVASGLSDSRGAQIDILDATMKHVLGTIQWPALTPLGTDMFPTTTLTRSITLAGAFQIFDLSF